MLLLHTDNLTFQDGGYKMFNNNTYFLGYGVLISEKEITSRTKSSSKAYQTLRDNYCDNIIVDVIKTPDAPRPFIKDRLYNEKKIIENNKQELVLVIPTLETLGGNEKQIKEIFEMLILSVHLIVLNRPELSTYNLMNEELIHIDDWETRQRLVKKLATVKVKSRQGRKAKEFDVSFRKVFWQWQNFTITTEEALNLLKISKPTLFAMTKEFMTSPESRPLYKKEFKEFMIDYSEKPVRGVALDEPTRKLVAGCQRRMGDNWDMAKVLEIAKILYISPVQFIPEDYYRFRLNFKGKKTVDSEKLTLSYDKIMKTIEETIENLDNLPASTFIKQQK